MKRLVPALRLLPALFVQASCMKFEGGGSTCRVELRFGLHMAQRPMTGVKCSSQYQFGCSHSTSQLAG